jgi:ABC-type glycerol-3-phosphate transport system substrate-binding protein
MKLAFLAVAIATITLGACTGGSSKTTDEVTTSDTSNLVTKDTMQIIKDSTVKTTVTVDTSKLKKDTSKMK